MRNRIQVLLVFGALTSQGISDAIQAGPFITNADQITFKDNRKQSGTAKGNVGVQISKKAEMLPGGKGTAASATFDLGNVEVLLEGLPKFAVRIPDSTI